MSFKVRPQPYKLFHPLLIPYPPSCLVLKHLLLLSLVLLLYKLPYLLLYLLFLYRR